MAMINDAHHEDMRSTQSRQA